MMSTALNKATERTLQSFLERITQIETNRCKDNTSIKTEESDSAPLTVHKNSLVKENSSKLPTSCSNAEKRSVTGALEKTPVFWESVQWTLEHAMSKPVPAPNQNKKPCNETFYLGSNCSGQRHEVTQPKCASLYHFQPYVNDDEPIHQVRYIYLQDNQQVRVQDTYHLQRHKCSPRPSSSYQMAWKSVSPSKTYPFQQNQAHDESIEIESSAHSEPLMMSNSTSSKATQSRSQPAQEPPTAFHPPPPPLQLRLQKQIDTLQMPLSVPQVSKRVQLLTSEHIYFPCHPLPPLPPLTPVAKFITPRHNQVNTLRMMQSSNEQDHQQQQAQYLQQQYQQQVLQLQQHQQLRSEERHQQFQQEHSDHQQFHQQQYQSQLQQQHFQHQHYQQQCHQQEDQLSQREQDEAICVVERIYFTTPEKENERKKIRLQDAAVKQREKETEHITVPCTTGLSHGNYLFEQRQTPYEYHRERANFQVALNVTGIDEKEEHHHLHRQGTLESESQEKVLKTSSYKIEEKLFTRKQLGSTQLKQETLTNSKPKRRIQFRCSAKARKKRLQRESMIVFEDQVETDANRNKNSVDEIQDIKSFRSLQSNKIATNSKSNTNIVQTTKQDASTQANTECCFKCN